MIPIYTEQPESFPKPGGEVCLLNKALYGLKQAGRAWQHSLFTVFKQQDYKQSIKEPCIWYKHQSTKLTLIGAYVDDLIITGDDESEISKLSITLSKNFKMKNLGELHEFLGIEVLKTSTGILLSQRKYCKEIVKRFGQDQCKPTWTPMTTVYDHAHDPQSDGSDEQKSRQFADKYPTREAIGCLRASPPRIFIPIPIPVFIPILHIMI